MLSDTVTLTSSTSANQCQWQAKEIDERLALTLAQKFSLPDIVAHILAGRGIEVDTAEDFLQPTLKSLMPDPYHLLDMDKAVERFIEAIDKQETIAIFGDYDVDGATSTSLIGNFLRDIGVAYRYYIPDRITEGYGPNSQALLSLKKEGVALVVTVDCGIHAFEPLAKAKEAGLDVVVIDHHLGAATLPESVAVVNPNRLDETSEHRHMAAVGVSFLFVAAIKSALEKKGFFTDKTVPNLLHYLDIVALGTVCDVVPLKGVNRAFVAQGLKILAKRNNIGLNALADVAQLDISPVAYHLGFVLGPRINAGGRVGKADLGTKLLTHTDYTQALAIARELDGFNQERKAIESMVLEEAQLQIEQNNPTQPMLFAASDNWHPGVIGIVAGRIKDRFYRPTAIIAIDEQGLGKASVRSISGIDIGALILSALQEGLLLAGGGHAMAAGFTVEKDKISALHDFLCQAIEKKKAVYENGRVIHYDTIVTVNALTTNLVKQLSQMEPYGMGNPEPRFVLRNVKLIKVDILSQAHLRCIIADANIGQSGQTIKAMAFRCIDTPLGDMLLANQGQIIELIGHVRLNSWQGRESVDFMIDDVKATA